MGDVNEGGRRLDDRLNDPFDDEDEDEETGASPLTATLVVGDVFRRLGAEVSMMVRFQQFVYMRLIILICPLCACGRWE